VAGELRGRRLHAARPRERGEPGARPSSQRTRTALFDSLGERVAGARVLDLFCGSGALGIEALSRGAALTVFVEYSAPALSALRLNLAELGLAERARVLPERVERALPRLALEGVRFELMLLDPPYAELPRAAPDGPRSASRARAGTARADAALDGAALGALAAPGALLVAERSRRHSAWELSGWELAESRAHGETRLDSYEWIGAAMKVKE
jgi:16S rRNA (guanine966-N2)-methyltransferase